MIKLIAWAHSLAVLNIIAFAVLIFCAKGVLAFQVSGRVHIEGIVVDSEGAAISEAQVLLKKGSRVVAGTITDHDGQFQIYSDQTQGLTLVVNSTGFAPYHRSLDSTSATPLRILLTPASISAEVTITATRTETRLSETAASVVVLAADKLKTTAATTLDDTLRQVAGFSLFRRSGSRTANPTSQGVSLRATGASGASRALVLADGLPLNDPFGGWVYWDRVPRESINDVEVLLGGASHLYGSAALGGVIDISTKKATNNALSLTASYGNETTPNASLFAAGRKRRWAASLAAEVFRTNGYVLVESSQRGVIDTPAGSRNAVVNLQVERTIGENGRVFGGASFFGEARKNGTPLQTNRTHVRQFVFGGEGQIAGAGSLNARAYGGTQLFDQNFSAIAADRNSETLTRVQRVPAQVFGFSAQWSRQVGRRQTLVAGVEGREVRGASDEVVYVNGRASSFVGAGGRQREVGVYVEDLIRLGSRVFLNFGARVDRWRNFAALSASRPVTATNPTSVNFFPDRVESAFSPHGSAVYKLSDRVSLMASVSRAFRAPTLNELYRSFRVGNVLTLSNEELRAERLTGGEAGARLTTRNESLAMRATFFWNDITRPVANVTLQTTPALITRQRQNLGTTRSRGLELQTDAKLSRFWSVSAGYVFADATVLKFPVNTSLEGLQLPQVPRQQLTFQARYVNPLLVTMGFQGRASSRLFDDDQNLFQLRKYFTLDAFVSRRLHPQVEIFCAVENLFNQRYEVGKTPLTTIGPPILVRAGFRFRH